MLNHLRTTTKQTIIKIILIILLISLIFSGINEHIINNYKNYAAKVNGVLISKKEAYKNFQEEKKILKNKLKNQFFEIFNNKQNIQIFYNLSLIHLIEKELLNQYANQLGFKVSNKKIKKQIFSNSYLSKKNDILHTKYESILKNKNFIKYLKKDLINLELNEIFVKNEFELPNESKIYSDLLIKRKKFKTITLFLSKYISKQTVTDKEIKNYYNSNKNNFIEPKKIQVNYIQLNKNFEENHVFIEMNKLKEFYRNNLINFVTEGKKRYSFIQIQTRKKANEIIDQLQHGANFSNLSKINSTNDLNEKKYGSTGWMNISEIPNVIIKANLKNKGEISNIIKFDEKYIIIRLDDIIPKKIQPFQKVKNKIFNILKNKNKNKNFHLKKKLMYKLIKKNNQSLCLFKKIINNKIKNFNLLDKDYFPKKIKNNIINDYFVNKKKLIPLNIKIFNFNKNIVYIIQIEKYKKKSFQSFKKAKNTIIKFIKTEKSIKQMENDQYFILRKLKEKNEKITLKKFNLFFSKTKIIDFKKNEKFLMNKIFKIKKINENAPIYFSVKDKNNNFIIIKLINTTEKNSSKDKSTVYSQNYKKILRNAMIESLILHLYSKAEIEIN